MNNLAEKNNENGWETSSLQWSKATKQWMIGKYYERPNLEIYSIQRQKLMEAKTRTTYNIGSDKIPLIESS